MRLAEATSLAVLTEQGLSQRQVIAPEMKSGLLLAQEIWAEARDRGIVANLGGCRTAEQWRVKWLPSPRFHLVRMPLNAAALSCSPRTENLVLKKIYAREETPIVVDYNRNQVGRTPRGFVPQIIVIDGKHRFQAATLRGETHILAWVGEQAMEMVPALMAFSGGGGGPKTMVPASGAKLVADKLKKIRSQSSGQETRLATRTGTFAEGKRLQTLNVKRLMSEYLQDKKLGNVRAEDEIQAKSPPGCEHMVKGLKDADVDNPWAVAWWHYGKYGGCGKGGK